MILADTSVWVDHFRSPDPLLKAQLEHCTILMHPFVVGELALGSIRKRTSVLRELDSLPAAKLAHSDEVRFLIEQRALFSRGIGFIDAHLLASVVLTPHTLLWTRDKRLRDIARSFGLHVSIV